MFEAQAPFSAECRAANSMHFINGIHDLARLSFFRLVPLPELHVHPPTFSTVTKRATIKPTRSQPYPCSFLPSLSAAVALNFIYYPPFLSLSKENEDSKP